MSDDDDSTPLQRIFAEMGLGDAPPCKPVRDHAPLTESEREALRLRADWLVHVAETFARLADECLAGAFGGAQARVLQSVIDDALAAMLSRDADARRWRRRLALNVIAMAADSDDPTAVERTRATLGRFFPEIAMRLDDAKIAEAIVVWRRKGGRPQGGGRRGGDSKADRLSRFLESVGVEASAATVQQDLHAIAKKPPHRR
ncbi:MAG: hypothetical protein HYV09_18030 [Deltaproteobacteria bacterium]|nr:hypothetical protein [Deltaproteobacteria bacterium]